MTGAGRSRLLARIGLAVWGAVVLWTSLAPVQDVPGLTSMSDKVLHGLAYLVLGALGALAFPGVRVITVVTSLVAFGLGIEILQWFTGYRQFEWTDLLADLVGAAAGVVVVRLVTSRRLV